MNAQVKPNEQAALDVRKVNRRGDVFEIQRLRHRERTKEGVEDDRLSTIYATLLEEISQAVERDLQKILANHENLDECETGRLIHEAIGGFGLRLYRAREAKEMLRNEFMPSWRSRVEP